LKEKLEEIARALRRTVPSDLSAVIKELSRSAWPEMVQRWSRLTPTGFPVELTITAADPILRWTAEIAGPEIGEAHRLGLVAVRLSSAGQPVPAPLLDAIGAAQRGNDLCYGAWLGGRTVDDAPSRFKLYAEIPSGVSPQDYPLPPTLAQAMARAPRGTLLRMIGVEPALGRIEIYLRLPVFESDDLRPLLNAAGHPHGLDALESSLPDGMRRLAGRRIGISLASTAPQSVEVALFASARSLFPAAPDLLCQLIPALTTLPETLARPTLVTMRLNAEKDHVSFAVGITVSPEADPSRSQLAPAHRS